jgi:hypothetical protein
VLGDIVNANNYTVFAAFNLASVTTTSGLGAYDNNSLWSSGNQFGIAFDTTPRTRCYHVEFGLEDVADTSLNVGTTDVITHRYDGSNIYARNDLGSETSTPAADIDSTGYGMVMAANGSVDWLTDIKIGEIIVYNQQHTASQRDDVVNYLKTRYG